MSAEETTPEVIAYRLGQIERTLHELREETVTPAVYHAHRQADEQARLTYQATVEARFRKIEREQEDQADAGRRLDESRRGTMLAIVLAIMSPIIVTIVGRIFPVG